MRAACLAAALLLAAPALAADGLGIAHEKIVTLKGRVVDLLCAVGGSCAAECGAGRRQLGLLTEDGRLRVLAKSPVDFAGAAADAAPHCGKSIEVDGVLIENPAMVLLQIQAIRASADLPWTPAGAFLVQWRKAHGEAAEWMRADPLAREIIAADGVLGIKGLEPKK